MARRLLAAGCLLAVGMGGILHLAGAPAAGDLVLALGSGLVLVPLTWSVARSLAARDVGVDAIALLAIAGALVLGQWGAAAVVALMLAGGNALEEAAAGRARRELRTLVERAPRVAHRVGPGGTVEELPVGRVEVGDALVVRAGEIVPVDGVLTSLEAIVDESSMTGEPLPVVRERGDSVRSGASNAGDAFELRATRPAAESAYAAVVRLVQEAESRKAPFVRLADRYAIVFLPLTIAVAGLAWALSGDPVRALAVLVVATPCPLILAAPIAFVAGVSRAARAGVIVKGGGVIEVLGKARTVLLDKTGTLTLGAPQVARVVVGDGLPAQELVRLTASLEQLSAHPLAEALVHHAVREGLPLSFPEQVTEEPGQGIAGVVDGRRVAAGGARWLAAHGHQTDDGPRRTPDDPGRATISVAVDGRPAGAIVMADQVRQDAPRLVAELRAAGIERVVLVTGDRAAVGSEVGRSLGLDRGYPDLSPAEKGEVVRAMQEQPGLRSVVMVGDGVNDAPALALADVGIAMGAVGATVASETADAVIVHDRVDRVAAAVRIGRRSLSIARQSVLAGMGLSLVAMGLAAAGLIVPIAGALLQEAIDVAVILNALRALGD
ncbi:MAG TPA: heavy metal translocating P-type ATPase [Gaiellaceae bacterium]